MKHQNQRQLTDSPPFYSIEPSDTLLSSQSTNLLPHYTNSTTMNTATTFNRSSIPLSPIRGPTPTPPTTQESIPLNTAVSPLSSLQPSLHHFNKSNQNQSSSTKTTTSIQSILSQVDKDIHTHLSIVNNGFHGSTTPIRLQERNVEVDQYMIPYIHGREQQLGTWKYKNTSSQSTGHKTEDGRRRGGLLKKMSTLFKKQ